MVLYVTDGLYRLPACRTVLVALTEAAQLVADGISSCCCNIVNLHNLLSRYNKLDVRWVGGGGGGRAKLG